MKAVVAAFNQEKALVGAFSVITNLRMELFQALYYRLQSAARPGSRPVLPRAGARQLSGDTRTHAGDIPGKIDSNIIYLKY